MAIKRKSSGYKNILIWLMMMFHGVVVFSQSPVHLPRKKPVPVGFFDSIENTIFFVVIPVVIAILYFVWKRNIAAEQKKKSGLQ